MVTDEILQMSFSILCHLASCKHRWKYYNNAILHLLPAQLSQMKFRVVDKDITDDFSATHYLFNLKQKYVLKQGFNKMSVAVPMLI